MSVWKKCRTDAAGPPRPALFLDRDGVVIVDRDYLSDPDRVELIDGAADAMKAAAAAGYLLIGISNQSGIGRNLFPEAALVRVMERLDDLLAARGTGFDGFYYCPHAPEDGCSCRKPETGLLDEAAESCRWNPTKSWVVGDKASDVGLAVAAGMGGVLVRTGHGTEYEDEIRLLAAGNPRVLVASDLAAAFDLLRETERRGRDR